MSEPRPDALARLFSAASVVNVAYKSELDDPQFGAAIRVHDWRNYVPDVVQDVWPHLDVTARAAVYLCAHEMADREEWE